MSKITSSCFLRLFVCLFCSFPFLSIPGLADIPSTSTPSNGNKSSGNSTPLTILIIFMGLLSVGGFSIFLYKLWQRKTREEQHARLLKLFEQDDELEIELGIRD